MNVTNVAEFIQIKWLNRLLFFLVISSSGESINLYINTNPGINIDRYQRQMINTLNCFI